MGEMALCMALTHGDIRKCVSAAMSVDSVEVWSSGVHTPYDQIGSYMPLVPTRMFGKGSMYVRTCTSLVHHTRTYLYKYCLSILKAVATLG